MYRRLTARVRAWQRKDARCPSGPVTPAEGWVRPQKPPFLLFDQPGSASRPGKIPSSTPGKPPGGTVPGTRRGPPERQLAI